MSVLIGVSMSTLKELGLTMTFALYLIAALLVVLIVPRGCAGYSRGRSPPL
jgi:hypothetical protein